MVFIDGRHNGRPAPARGDLLPWRAAAGVTNGVSSLRARFSPDPPAVDAELLPEGWTPDLDDESEVA